MRMRIVNLLWGGLLLLSSCRTSLSREEQIEHLLSPPCLATSIESALDSPFFVEGSWPATEWWQSFEEPQLDTLIVEALGNNPSLQEVSARIEVARQESIIARSKLFPLISFQATDTWAYLSQNGLYRALNPSIPLSGWLIDLSLAFSYEFDFWDKNANLFRASLGRELAREAETAQSRLLIATGLAQGYFALKTNLVRRALYQELVEVRQASTALQELLREQGLLSKLPTLLAEESLLAAQQWLEGIEDEIEKNRHLINVLAGRNPDAPLDVDCSLPPLPASLALPCDLSLNLLSRRPDLMAQLWTAKSLAYEAGAAIADFYPNINLSALVGLESVTYAKLFEASSFTASVTPAIYLPIFTAGAIQANVDAKKARFDEAVYAYNRLLLTSAQEVADTLSFTRTVYRQREEQQAIVSRSQERYALTLLRKEQGLETQLTAYAFQEELILKELDEIRLLYDQYVATVKLIKALGGGYVVEYGNPLEECP